MTEKWFRSEKKLLEYLRSIGLDGKNGRIYRSGIVLKAENLYGQYSEQSWFVQLRSEA